MFRSSCAAAGFRIPGSESAAFFFSAVLRRWSPAPFLPARSFFSARSFSTGRFSFRDTESALTSRGFFSACAGAVFSTAGSAAAGSSFSGFVPAPAFFSAGASASPACFAGTEASSARAAEPVFSASASGETPSAETAADGGTAAPSPEEAPDSPCPPGAVPDPEDAIPALTRAMGRTTSSLTAGQPLTRKMPANRQACRSTDTRPPQENPDFPALFPRQGSFSASDRTLRTGASVDTCISGIFSEERGRVMPCAPFSSARAPWPL